MNQNSLVACEHIVRVEVGDGEVVDALAGGPLLDRGDLDADAGEGAQPHADLEVPGVDPLAQRGQSGEVKGSVPRQSSVFLDAAHAQLGGPIAWV
ncbi:hypothetical protein [Streptosporangium sp. NPDC003464]